MIGAALDLGAGRRGVDMGPSAIRYAGLAERLAELGREVIDHGNVPADIAEATDEGDEHARFLRADHAHVRADRRRRSRRRARGGLLPARARRRPLGRARLARRARVACTGPAASSGSTRTATSTGPRRRRAATCTAWRSRPRSASRAPGFESEAWPTPAVDRTRVALVGTRQLDEGERELIREHGMRVWTMSTIDQLGMERTVREALEHVAGDGFVHVSLDMDALDPGVAPGVGTPVRGGLRYREAHLALELIAEANVLTSLDVVEVNPVLDVANETGKLAVELIASALGARIL